MIFLFTDFGFKGPYVGQMKAAIAARAPGVPVVDLMHDAPAFAPKPAAYLLAALAEELPPQAIVCGVVDPGVGSARPPVVVEADGRFFVGPGNGLFAIAARRARQARTSRLALEPQRLSASFHGRDLFAPAAARLALQQDLPLAPLEADLPGGQWPDDLAEVIYIDGYGNAMTGLRAAGLGDAAIVAGGTRLARARTFSDRGRGEGFWYANSSGLAEIAVNQGSAAKALALRPGTAVGVERT